MNDDFRDPVDGAISHDLNALAPSDLDAEAALGAMRPALARARARRRLAVSSSAVAAVVIVLGVGALLAGGHSSHVNVSQHSSTLPDTRPATSPPTTRNRVSTSTTRSSTSTSIAPVPSGTAVTSPTTESHGGTSTPGPGSTTKPPATPPPSTHTYTSTGGTITVTFANGVLTLDSHTPAPGYSDQVTKADPDDVEVRFSNGSTDWRIRVRVENGRLQPPEITKN